MNFINQMQSSRNSSGSLQIFEKTNSFLQNSLQIPQIQDLQNNYLELKQQIKMNKDQIKMNNDFLNRKFNVYIEGIKEIMISQNCIISQIQDQWEAKTFTQSLSLDKQIAESYEKTIQNDEKIHQLQKNQQNYDNLLNQQLGINQDLYQMIQKIHDKKQLKRREQEKKIIEKSSTEIQKNLQKIKQEVLDGGSQKSRINELFESFSRIESQLVLMTDQSKFQSSSDPSKSARPDSFCTQSFEINKLEDIIKQTQDLSLSKQFSAMEIEMEKRMQKYTISLSMLSDNYNVPIKKEEEAKLEVMSEVLTESEDGDKVDNVPCGQNLQQNMSSMTFAASNKKQKLTKNFQNVQNGSFISMTLSNDQQSQEDAKFNQKN